MCGIAGYVGLVSGPAGNAALRRMARQLEPRGPAGEGIVRHGPVGLVHRRRTGAGSQPLRSADGRYLLVYDGEVYNHPELRAALTQLALPVSGTDAEVVLAAWRQWGSAGLDRCNGMFALAVLDTETGEVTLARDPYGIKSLYLAADGSGRVAFGSDLRSVLAAAVVPRRPDDRTVHRYLRYGVTDDTDRTFFDRISRLGPGELATIAPTGEVRREVYSRFHGELDLLGAARRPYDDETARELAAALTAAVRRRAGEATVALPELVPAIVDPADGAWASEPVQPGPPGDPLHTDLLAFVRAQQEPVHSPAPYGQFRQLRRVADGGVVVLDGQVAAGAGPAVRQAHRWAPARRWYAGAADRVRAHLTLPAEQLLGPDFRSRYAGDPAPAARSAAARQLWRAGQLLPPGAPACAGPAAEVFRRRLPASLRYADRNAARFGVTVRVPLLDPAVLRLLWSIGSPGPAPAGADHRVERAWLTRLTAVVEQVFTSGSFASRSYVDQPAVLAAYRAHLGGRRSAAPMLFWRLVNLELWLREWVDRDPTWPPASTLVEHHRPRRSPPEAAVPGSAGRVVDPAEVEPAEVEPAGAATGADGTDTAEAGAGTPAADGTGGQEAPGSSLRRTNPSTSATSPTRSSSASPT